MTEIVKQENQLVVPDKFDINNQEVNMANLVKRIDEVSSHLIKGVDDKEGIKKATAYRAEFRSLRTALEDHRMVVSRPVQKFLKDLKSATDKLGAKAKTAEEFFDSQLKAVEEEKARIKKEAEEAKQRAFLARISDLTAHGAVLAEGSYILPYNSDIDIPVSSIGDMSDEAWLVVLDAVIVAHDIERERLEQERKAEEQRLADEKTERERLEAENKRLQEELSHFRLKNVGTPPSETEDIVVLTDAITGKPVSAYVSPTISQLQSSDFNGKRVDEDNTECIMFTFSETEPFIEIAIRNKEAVRIYPQRFDDEAYEGSSTEQDVKVGVISGGQLWYRHFKK